MAPQQPIARDGTRRSAVRSTHAPQRRVVQVGPTAPTDEHSMHIRHFCSCGGATCVSRQKSASKEARGTTVPARARAPPPRSAPPERRLLHTAYRLPSRRRIVPTEFIRAEATGGPRRTNTQRSHADESAVHRPKKAYATRSRCASSRAAAETTARISILYAHARAGGAQVQRAHLNCAGGALLDQHSAGLSRLHSLTRCDSAAQAIERRRAAAAAVASARSQLGGAQRSQEAYRAP